VDKTNRISYAFFIIELDKFLMTLNVLMPLFSLAIFVSLDATSPFPVSYGLLVKAFVLFIPSMPRIVKVGEVRFTTSSSTSLYCFSNY
jgi:hypothetical protein